jgi:hypothetical protein
MLMHVAMQAAPGTLLVRDWIEARALWDRLCRIERLRAAVVMPTHDHALVPKDQVSRVKEAARGYALWRNRHRGESGQVWGHGAEGVRVGNEKHVQRAIRYLHMNPCREGLVTDPLAWPFSTHRDMLGLAWPAARLPVADAEAFHRWVSADPTVSVSGTSLPRPPAPERLGSVSLAQILAAVSAVTRTPEPELTSRGPARTLVIRSCRLLTRMSQDRIAQAMGVGRGTVHRAGGRPDVAVKLVARVLDDPRFALLTDTDLPWLPPGR